MNFPTSLSTLLAPHDATPTSCAAELAQIIRDGQLIAAVRTNPMYIISCVAVIAAGILHRYSEEAPIVFGTPTEDTVTLTAVSDDFDTEIVNLAEAMEIPVPMNAAGNDIETEAVKFGPFAKLLLAKLLDEISKIISDYFTT
jgi:hypothetical protein